MSAEKQILIIGESCVDKFVYGSCTRLSPEAPVPVFKTIRYTTSPGMAGNVQSNVLSLGANADLVTNSNWKQVIKSRYVEQRTNHMFIRVDENDQAERISLDSLPDLSSFAAIIISDYCKGFLHEDDIAAIASNHGLVFLDTKKKLGDWCHDIAFVKINGHEYAKTKDTIPESLHRRLIVTLGNLGCRYHDKIFAVDDVEVKDVSGAGDTFMASMVVEYLRSENIHEAVQFANACATQVVQKRGVSTI